MFTVHGYECAYIHTYRGKLTQKHIDLTLTVHSGVMVGASAMQWVVIGNVNGAARHGAEGREVGQRAVRGGCSKI